MVGVEILNNPLAYRSAAQPGVYANREQGCMSVYGRGIYSAYLFLGPPHLFVELRYLTQH